MPRARATRHSWTMPISGYGSFVITVACCLMMTTVALVAEFDYCSLIVDDCITVVCGYCNFRITVILPCRTRSSRWRRCWSGIATWRPNWTRRRAEWPPSRRTPMSCASSAMRKRRILSRWAIGETGVCLEIEETLFLPLVHLGFIDLLNNIYTGVLDLKYSSCSHLG